MHSWLGVPSRRLEQMIQCSVNSDSLAQPPKVQWSEFQWSLTPMSVFARATEPSAFYAARNECLSRAKAVEEKHDKLAIAGADDNTTWRRHYAIAREFEGYWRDCWNAADLGHAKQTLDKMMDT